MIGKTFNKTFHLLNFSKKNFGANEKLLKNRIKSVSSIAKITKAMKMVSSSKMKADLARLQGGKNYGSEGINKIFTSDTYMQKFPKSAGNRVLYVPFTSDRGLCGSINSGIIREVKSAINNNPNRNQCGLYIIGDKGTNALSRPCGDILIRGVHDLIKPINFSTAASIAHDIGIVAQNFDKIILIHNFYINAITSTVTKVELMNRKSFVDMTTFGRLYEQKVPDKNSSCTALYDLYISSNIYRALLNSLASEQSARMNAMENASKNAKEIVEKLLLDYNKARQSRITMELIEIISGASAV